MLDTSILFMSAVRVFNDLTFNVLYDLAICATFLVITGLSFSRVFHQTFSIFIPRLWLQAYYKTFSAN